MNYGTNRAFFAKIAAFSVLASIPAASFAVPASPASPAAPDCPAASAWSLSGPDAAKAGSAAEYALKSPEGASVATAAFSVWKDGKRADSVGGTKFAKVFSAPGKYRVEISGKDSRGCGFYAGKDVTAYSRYVAYVGAESRYGLDLGFEARFAARGELFRRFVQPAQGTAPERLLAALDEGGDFLAQSDRVIVDVPDVAAAFQSLARWAKGRGADLSKKELYVISALSDSFLNRILAANARAAGITEVRTVREGAFFGVLAAMAEGKGLTPDQAQSFTLSFTGASKLYALSYAVDSILYAGFPPDLLGLLLAAAAMALVVAVFGQVLGLSAFGTYYPILFALSLSTLGVGPSFLLLGAAFVAALAVRAFASRVYLLHASRKATFLCLYLALAVSALAADRVLGTGLVDYAAFSNSLVVFPVVAAAMVAERLFDEDFALWTRSGWSTAFEFALVAGTSYALAEWTALRYFLLAYPEAALALIAACALMGRFTGLQAVEYFRFLPLFRGKGGQEE